MRLVRAGTVAALAVLLAACSDSRSVEHTETANECGRCHGYPPPPYVTAGGSNHPNDARCSLCHPGTVEADDVTIIPGGEHMDGVVQAGHPMPYLAQHTSAALASIASCQQCHGVDYGGGLAGAAPSCNGCHAANVTASAPDWKQNCTFCHGTRTQNVTAATAVAAPPQSVAGAIAVTVPAVGAHQAHLEQGPYANALPCSSCHAVPAGADALTHFDGGAADLAFSTLATQGVATPGYSSGTCAVYCHGSGNNVTGGSNTNIAWTTPGIACDACHTTAPTSGMHAYHRTQGVACTQCHPGYALGTPGTVDRDTHLNGTLEATPSNAGGQTFSSWPTDCGACH